MNFSWVIDGKLAGHQRPSSEQDLVWFKKQGILALVRMTREYDMPCVTGMHDVNDIDATEVMKTFDRVFVDGYVESMAKTYSDGAVKVSHFGAAYHSVGSVLLPTVHKMTMAEQIEEIKKREVEDAGR